MDTEIIESPLNEIILEVAKNAQHIEPELQRVIARYLDVGTSPRIKLSERRYKV